MYQENEKKEYCKPEMEVIAFSYQTNLLDCSSPEDECFEGHTG